MRISDWSSDVCSSDLHIGGQARQFEPDVERYEVHCGNHHAHAHRIEQQEHRIFAAIASPLLEIARSDDEAGCTGHEDQDLGETAEGIHAVEPAKGVAAQFI